MTGTIINVLAILGGTALGTLLGDRLPAGTRERVTAGLGLITLVLGIDDALHWQGHTYDPLYVLGGVLLGGIAGEALGIERRLSALGDRLQARTSEPRTSGPRTSGQRTSGQRTSGQRTSGRARAVGPSTVSQAFFTASLLFCVGPLTVLGSIEDGLGGHTRTLVIKSTLDGFASIALSATLGWGVALAAGTVLVIQGSLTLGAELFRSVLQGEALQVLTSVGGILIIGIALKLLAIRDVRVGNYLPALVLAPALYGLASAFS